MNFLTKLFKKKPAVEIPPRPSWETVVEMDVIDEHSTSPRDPTKYYTIK